MIDRDYPTDASTAGRALLGTSLGGMHATYMGFAYPELFGALAIQSPAFLGVPWMLDELDAAESFAPRAFVNIGLYERWLLPDTRRAVERLREMGIDLRYEEVPEDHSFGQWRALLDDILIFFFGV